MSPLPFMRGMALRGQPVPDRPHRQLPALQGREGGLLRLSPASAEAARRTRSTRTPTRRSSATSRACSGRWTGCGPRSGCGSATGFHLTEFGYETSPPDPASGISLALQTRYLQQAAYIAWKTKRVRGLSFYQWDDEPTKNLGGGTRRYFGWQTGLRFNNGRPKPVLSTMPAPFVIDRSERRRARRCCGARCALTPSRA